MRWWHAVIVALGLVVGGALSGGVYTFTVHDGEWLRFNRFTGAVDGYRADVAGVGWLRLPNTVDHTLADALRERRKRTINLSDMLKDEAMQKDEKPK